MKVLNKILLSIPVVLMISGCDLFEKKEEEVIISLDSYEDDFGVANATIDSYIVDCTENVYTEKKCRVKTETTSDFVSLTTDEWGVDEVKKVMNTFTYGITASESQIAKWAEMAPSTAIEEVMNFDAHNPLLKPSPTNNLNSFTKIEDISSLLYNYYKETNVGLADRFALPSKFPRGDIESALITSNLGYNPLRLRIGLWETSYHQVINTNVDVLNAINTWNYFDNIVEGIAAGTPYEEILAKSATSTNIMYMYKQFDNVYKNNTLVGNDDFAREYNQLFFGILGKDNLSYYENTTIENTALVLTGMKNIHTNFTAANGDIFGGPGYSVIPVNTLHYAKPVEISEKMVQNENVIDGLMEIAKISIDTDESLDTLPLIIIEGLADDNLKNNIHKMETVRNAWKIMPKKDILAFLKKYAISRSFHSNDRIKYLSTMDRTMKIYNLMNVEDKMPHHVLRPRNEMEQEGYTMYVPGKGVFGNWTGVDIKNNTNVYKEYYNGAANQRYYNIYPNQDMSKLIDSSVSNNVKDITEYLWSKFVGDNLKNFGIIERLHVYALLKTGNDFNSAYGVSADIDLNVFDSSNSVRADFKSLETSEVDLNNNEIRNNIAKVVNFIIAMPYALYEEGV